MVYLTLGDLIVCSPEQGHPQRIHVHLERKASDKCINVFMNSDTKKGISMCFSQTALSEHMTIVLLTF